MLKKTFMESNELGDNIPRSFLYDEMSALINPSIRHLEIK